MKKYYYKLIILAGIISLACSTRVSEWILLNSLPNQYSLVYFHSAPLSGEVTKENTALKKQINTANIIFKTVARQDIKEPYFGLYYENRLFSKYQNTAELAGLTTSSLREKIAADLLAGNLCVMLYLLTDDKEKDDKGLETLNQALNSSPFGEIIKVYELSRNSREEKHFTSFLLNIEDDLKEIQDPMIFGIFGRFKALEPLLGRGISEENINLMIDYFKAECSCLIKDNLPGTDILYTEMWDNPQPALLNKIIDDNPSLY